MFNPHGLTQQDLDMIRDYVNMYGSDEDNSVKLEIPVEEYLRAWDTDKSFLHKMFNDTPIIREKVKFVAGLEEIRNSLEDAFYSTHDHDGWGEEMVSPIINMLSVAICGVPYSDRYEYMFEKRKEWSYISDIRRVLYDIDTYASNKCSQKICYDGDIKDIKFPVFSAEQKPFKMINKLLAAFGNLAAQKNSEIFTPEFFTNLKNAIEYYRIKHSQVLNCTTLTGDLCLSVHPLDYITASDNTYDWDSCMTWTRDNPGEYRVGTVEMMNSPIVVVAYLEGDRPFYPFNDSRTWSNKKWREFFIVDRDIISCIRGYPYQSPNLEKVILEKLAAMAQAAGYPAYDDIKESQSPVIDGKKVCFETNMMYNDAQYYTLFYKASTEPSGEHLITVGTDTYNRINYSGVAICPKCGREFFRNNEEADVIVCENCDDTRRCCQCGCRIDESEDYEINGEWYCSDCAVQCEMCEELIPQSEAKTVCCMVTYPCRYAGGDLRTEWGWLTLCEDCFMKIRPWLAYTDHSFTTDNGAFVSAGSFICTPELPEDYAFYFKDRIVGWNCSNISQAKIESVKIPESSKKIS